MTYYVYVLASKRNGTLYVGVTSNLIRRIYEHKSNLVKGFTEKYDVHMLVHYESCESVESAIGREEQLKEAEELEAKADRGDQSTMDRPVR